MNKKCMFGSQNQEASKCSMIYIHWPGYYPGKENYLRALMNLCPNVTPELREELKRKIKNERG